MKRVIAMDGPAGSGKSTIAGLIATKLGFIHADSGAIYRTLTLALMKERGPGATPEEFGEGLKGMEGRECHSLKVEVTLEEGRQSNRISGEDVGDAIRTPEVTSRIRYIADNPLCREEVNRLLREFASLSDLVVDGRDIGTVVFPDAPYKFFLVASPRTRALRRMKEFAEKGRMELTIEEVEKDIRKRDQEDENRPFGSLRRAGDAILIDTSELTINDVLARITGFLQIQF